MSSKQTFTTQQSIRLVLIAMIISMLAAFFRITKLNYTGYWIDEMSSIHFAGNAHWGALFWDNSPPLYHLLLKFWIKLFGTAEAATRSLSAIFSLTTTILWMREGFNRKGLAGLITCGLAHACLAASVLHARETRMYAMFELASTIFFLLVVRICEGKPVRPLHFSVSILGLMLSHFLAILPLAVGVSAIAWTRRNEASARKLMVILGVGFAVALLSIFTVRWQPLAWQMVRYKVEPGSHWPTAVIPEIWGSWWSFGLFSLLAAGEVIRKNRLATAASIGILICFLFSTIAGFATSRAVFSEKYFVPILPLIMLVILSLPIQFSKNNWDRARVALFTVFVALLFTSSLRVLAQPNPPWEQAAQIIRASIDPVIYTTRPLSLASPYFDERELHLDKLLLVQNGYPHLIAQAKSGRSVWVLENYWGMSYYRGQLEKYLSENGCSFSPQVLENGAPDVIIIGRVICP
jgi:hypothetical protein